MTVTVNFTRNLGINVFGVLKSNPKVVSLKPGISIGVEVKTSTSRPHPESKPPVPINTTFEFQFVILQKTEIPILCSPVFLNTIILTSKSDTLLNLICPFLALIDLNTNFVQNSYLSKNVEYLYN